VRTSFSLLAAGLALLVSLPARPAAAQPRERELYVSILDKNKHAVGTTPQPQDLIVREDNVVREILRIVPASDPIQVAILVDNSQAATRAIQRMRDGLNAFIDRVANGKNEISIVTMGDRPTLMVDATTDADKLKKDGANRLFATPGSGTYLLESVLETTKGFRKKDSARPVIVALLTEGIEFSNQHYDEVLKGLKDSGTELFVLLLTEGAEANPNNDAVRNRNIVIDRGTRETGGRREQLLSDMAIQDAMSSIADELLHQFKVTYGQPDRLIPPEKITVEAKNPAWTARGVPVKLPEKRESR
jgi:von Willebrand factor type A domain